MIRREDMLELTRRMTPARSSAERIAGAYFDEEGYIDGTFNTHFLNLTPSERAKNLNMAKTVLISKTNDQLKDHLIPLSKRKQGDIWQLLDGIVESGLKDDALLDILYELVGEHMRPGYPFAVFFIFGRYDVPVKGSDREWMEGSEEVYTYLLCSISPLSGEYEPGKPVFGFLYPAFRDRTTDREHINIFEERPESFRELKDWLLGVSRSAGRWG